MKNGSNEFLGMLCKLYMIVLLVALPLYTGEGYWNLGDTKYMLFRNLSALCLGCWLAVGMSGHILAVVKRRRAPEAGKASLRRRFSAVDYAVVSYGGVVVLSAFLSPYGDLAWTGYAGWYMGAASQLLFIGIYFFVSRRYDGGRLPFYLGEAALLLVSLLGLLHRLGIDPLKLLIYWTSEDWEYSHMLSTLGNINWLCGYYSVALAFLAVHFLWEERGWLRIFLYIGTVLAFVLLGVQGSQGGLLILAVCTVCCLFLGRGQPMMQCRVWALLTGFFWCLPLMRLGMKLRGDKAAVVWDDKVFNLTPWYVWVIAGAVSLVVCLRLVRKGRIFGSWIRHRPVRAAFLGGAAVCAALGLIVVLGHGIDDSFGSGRGFLWRISVESFGRAGVKEKLLGAGPDCYAEAVFNKLGAGSNVWEGEHWEMAVFTNAHNEILSQLCNVGILGTLSYLGIFLAGLWRYYNGSRRGLGGGQGQGKEGCDSRDLWIGLLAIGMYGAHAMISFQQVLNTPFLFLALGISENRMRMPNIKQGNGTGEKDEVEKI